MDVYERDALTPAAAITGPAIIDEFGSTTIVPPDWIARLDESGNLLLERA